LLKGTRQQMDVTTRIKAIQEQMELDTNNQEEINNFVRD
jgi:hypothetical protein